MPQALSFVKKGSLKKVLRKHSGCEQVAEETLELGLDKLDQMLTEMLTKIAESAGDSARSEKLVKMMPRNFEHGFLEVTGEVTVAPEPQRFLEALHKMDIQQLGEVLRLISEWIKSEEAKLK